MFSVEGLADFTTATAEAAGGDNQQTAAGQLLPAPLVVLVEDSLGNPLPGAEVDWLFSSGSGFELGGDGAQKAPSLTLTTDAQGRSSVEWQVGTEAGPQTASASVPTPSAASGSTGGGSVAVSFTAEVAAGPVVTLGLTPGTAEVGVGQSLTLSVAPKDTYGNDVTGLAVSWSSSDASVVTVDSNGRLTGVKAGTATVAATSGSLQETATVSVTSDAAGVAIVSGDHQSGTVGTSLAQALKVRVTSSTGTGVPGTSVAWSVITGNGSVSPATSTTDSQGYAESSLTLGTKAGANTVRATISGASVDFTASATAGPVASLDVTPATASVAAGGTKQFSAAARDQFSNVVNGVSVTWSSTATSIATVDAQGLAHGVAGGQTYIKATAGTVSDSSSLTVSAATSGGGSQASVVVTPTSVSLGAINGTAQLTATARDSAGTVVGSPGFTWRSLSTSIATVSASGVVTARAQGTAKISVTASCCGADTATVVVDQVPSSISLTPSSLSLQAGGTGALSASVVDAGGAAVGGVTMAWSSADNAIATVSGSGGSATVTAVAGGSTNITVTATKSGTQVSQSAAVQVTATSGGSSSLVNECSSPGAGWIWCDDFDQNRLSNYFEYDNAGGSFTRGSTVGVNGSGGMRAQFSAGQVSAGSLKLAFGKTPSSYMAPVDAGTANYREVYWRFYVHNASNWTGGGGDKLSRATVFAGSNWSQAMIAHLWSGGSGSAANYLVIDPASGTDTQGNLQTTGYNDFANMRWLGAVQGQTPIFDSNHVGQWYCVEAHVRLNDAGQSNGVFEYWIDGNMEAQKTGLNWLGSYSQYGINAILLENYWNSGSPQAQSRDLDNFVVSTQPIGCGGTTSPPPSTPTVASVTVSPSGATLTAPSGTQQMSATARDSNGNTMSGVSFTWTSSNSTVASVSSGGLVTGKSAGTATITATASGVSNTASITVQAQPSGSGVQPDFVEDFSTYTSTANLISDPRGIYSNSEDFYDNTSIGGGSSNNGAGTIELDKSDGYGSLTQSMKYTWFSYSSAGPGGTLGRYADLTAGAERWVEIAFKFSSNFKTAYGYTGGAAYKWVFTGGPRTGHGWALELVGNGGVLDQYFEDSSGGTGEHPSPYSNNFSLSNLADGNWHVLRIHIRKSPALYDVTIDGVRNRAPLTSWSTSASIGSLRLGSNINMRPVNNVQTLKYGYVKVWYAGNNPGW
jgi:uncharacterized protein YjdB